MKIFKINCCSGNKKFLAAARVFYVDNFFRAIDATYFYMGDETVGA